MSLDVESPEVRAAIKQLDVDPANNRFMLLVEDLLRPESLPRGWTANFNAVQGTWSYKDKTGAEHDKHPVYDYYIGAMFMDRGGYAQLKVLAAEKPPTQDEIQQMGLYFNIKKHEDPYVWQVAEMALCAPLSPDWEETIQELPEGPAVVFRNTLNGECQQEHPLDNYFRELIRRRRRELLKRKKSALKALQALVNMGGMARRAQLAALAIKAQSMMRMSSLVPQSPTSPAAADTEEATIPAGAGAEDVEVDSLSPETQQALLTAWQGLLGSAVQLVQGMQVAHWDGQAYHNGSSNSSYDTQQQQQQQLADNSALEQSRAAAAAAGEGADRQHNSSSTVGRGSDADNVATDFADSVAAAAPGKQMQQRLQQIQAVLTAAMDPDSAASGNQNEAAAAAAALTEIEALAAQAAAAGSDVSALLHILQQQGIQLPDNLLIGKQQILAANTDSGATAGAAASSGHGAASSLQKGSNTSSQGFFLQFEASAATLVGSRPAEGSNSMTDASVQQQQPYHNKYLSFVGCSGPFADGRNSSTGGDATAWSFSGGQPTRAGFAAAATARVQAALRREASGKAGAAGDSNTGDAVVAVAADQQPQVQAATAVDGAVAATFEQQQTANMKNANVNIDGQHRVPAADKELRQAIKSRQAAATGQDIGSLQAAATGRIAEALGAANHEAQQEVGDRASAHSQANSYETARLTAQHAEDAQIGSAAEVPSQSRSNAAAGQLSNKVHKASTPEAGQPGQQPSSDAPCGHAATVDEHAAATAAPAKHNMSAKTTAATAAAAQGGHATARSSQQRLEVGHQELFVSVSNIPVAEAALQHMLTLQAVLQQAVQLLLAWQQQRVMIRLLLARLKETVQQADAGQQQLVITQQQLQQLQSQQGEQALAAKAATDQCQQLQQQLQTVRSELEQVQHDKQHVQQQQQELQQALAAAQQAAAVAEQQQQLLEQQLADLQPLLEQARTAQAQEQLLQEQARSHIAAANAAELAELKRLYAELQQQHEQLISSVQAAQAAAASAQGQKQQLEQQLQDTQQQLQNSEHSRAAQTAECEGHQQQLLDTQQRLSQLQMEYKQQKDAVAGLQKQLKTLCDKHHTTQQEQQQQLQEALLQLQAEHEQLLQQLHQREQGICQLLAEKQQLLELQQVQQQQLVDKEHDLQQILAELQQLQQQLQQTKQQHEQSKGSAQQLHADLQQVLQDKQQLHNTLQQAQQQIQQLQAEREQLQETLSAEQQQAQQASSSLQQLQQQLQQLQEQLQATEQQLQQVTAELQQLQAGKQLLLEQQQASQQRQQQLECQITQLSERHTELLAAQAQLQDNFAAAQQDLADMRAAAKAEADKRAAMPHRHTQISAADALAQQWTRSHGVQTGAELDPKSTKEVGTPADLSLLSYFFREIKAKQRGGGGAIVGYSPEAALAAASLAADREASPPRMQTAKSSLPPISHHGDSDHDKDVGRQKRSGSLPAPKSAMGKELTLSTKKAPEPEPETGSFDARNTAWEVRQRVDRRRDRAMKLEHDPPAGGSDKWDYAADERDTEIAELKKRLVEEQRKNKEAVAKAAEQYREATAELQVARRAVEQLQTDNHGLKKAIDALKNGMQAGDMQSYTANNTPGMSDSGSPIRASIAGSWPGRAGTSMTGFTNTGYNSVASSTSGSAWGSASGVNATPAFPGASRASMLSLGGNGAIAGSRMSSVSGGQLVPTLQNPYGSGRPKSPAQPGFQVTTPSK